VQAPNQMARRVIRRSMLIVLLNILLIAGLFIAASYIEIETEEWFSALPEWTGGSKTVLWLAAVACSLPLYVASARKLNAISMIIAEMSVDQSLPEERKLSRRLLLTTVLFSVFSILLVGAGVLFSYALLPPFPVLVVLVCLLGVVMARDWNRMVRVYARAQAALRDTLADNTAEHSHAPQPVKDLLETVGLRTLTIEPNAPAAGKLIRELEVRRLTGAYIIGIERDGEAMINPSPDEELNVGDKVVLLGEDSQLSKAADLMLLAAY
jgi:CPA2 family monovalent cation:H+ antiporter-2